MLAPVWEGVLLVRFLVRLLLVVVGRRGGGGGVDVCCVDVPLPPAGKVPGIRTWSARPMSLVDEALRIRVLTARAAAPITRMNTTATITAVFDLMGPP